MSELDKSLIAEFNVRRSEDAFAALVRQHINLVFATALRQVGDTGAAEEITQNVFVALAQAAGKLGPHPTIAGWLHQTALNKSREWLRSELRRRKREQIAVNLDQAAAQGDSVWSPLVPLLDEALLKLREPDRQAVILHFMEGRTFQEVGSVIGVGEDAARKRVNRCLDQLTDFFRRRGFAVPALAAGAPLFALASHAAPTGLVASATTAGLAAAHTAASASTLTLLKGALKIMAWTKAKSAIVAGTAIILATGTTTLVMKTVHESRAASPPDIQGTWEGTAGIPGTPGVLPGAKARSRVVFRLFKTNGVYSATGEFIDTAREPFEVAQFAYDYPSVRFMRGRDSYQGKLNAGATEIAATLRRGNLSVPVLLKRTSEPDTAPEPLAKSDYAPRAGSDLQGAWNATLGGGRSTVRVTIKIGEPSPGIFRAELDNLTSSWLGQPMTVDYNAPKVELRVASGAGMFQGELRSDSAELVGDWIQNGKHTPVTFRRADR